MGLFKRKLIKCATCKKKVSLKKSWRVKMNTAEGEHEVRVCESCANHLNKLKEALYE